jgi:hypothetical protein
MLNMTRREFISAMGGAAAWPRARARAAMRSEADIQERGASVASVADDPLRSLTGQISFDAQHRQLTMW